MQLVVVRCPACRGQSQVEPSALGLTVACPRCNETFLAAEEAEVIAPPGVAPPRRASVPPTPAPRPQLYPDSPAGYARFDDLADTGEPKDPPDQDHDPDLTPKGLPSSVVIGLALLPFTIPILWVIAPLLLGQRPMLSLAVPITLAVSASVLCVAVIYTIDWTPATRIKGVLILLTLAFVTGTGLYFLKKGMVDRVRKFFGGRDETVVWRSQAGGFQVRLPAPPNAVPDQPVPGITLECHRLDPDGERLTYYVGFGTVPRPANGPHPGTAAWYNMRFLTIVAQAGGQPQGNDETIIHQGHAGREFAIQLADGRVRHVQIFLINDRLYYLAIEGAGLQGDDAAVKAFFGSFSVNVPAK